ncbi:hypothetical protein K438DRAFT_1845651 [Mycena galopus ATCC 62051]|nr:hypothetical protein K438DRAFT_1845651 [Mycena galopus ATCC 62051]
MPSMAMGSPSSSTRARTIVASSFSGISPSSISTWGCPSSASAVLSMSVVWWPVIRPSGARCDRVGDAAWLQATSSRRLERERDPRTPPSTYSSGGRVLALAVAANTSGFGPGALPWALRSVAAPEPEALRFGPGEGRSCSVRIGGRRLVASASDSARETLWGLSSVGLLVLLDILFVSAGVVNDVVNF